MDVLQLSHTGSVRTLCRLIQGMDRPVVVADGADEVMVVLSPSAFEGVLLRSGPPAPNCTVRPAPAPDGLF